MTDLFDHLIDSFRILFLGRSILIQHIIFINIFQLPNLFLNQLIRMASMNIRRQRIYIHKHFINPLFLLFRCFHLLSHLFLQTINLIFHLFHIIILNSTRFQHLFKLAFKLKQLLLQFLYLGFLRFQTLPHFSGPKAQHMLRFLQITNLIFILIDFLLLLLQRLIHLFNLLLLLSDRIILLHQFQLQSLDFIGSLLVILLQPILLLLIQPILLYECLILLLQLTDLLLQPINLLLLLRFQILYFRFMFILLLLQPFIIDLG